MFNVFNEAEQFIFCKLPRLNVKHRAQLNIGGNKFDYNDLSKMHIVKEDGKYSITPKIFSDNTNTKDVECIGLLSIGVMELYRLSISSFDEETFTIGTNQFLSNFLLNNLDLYDDVNDLYNVIRRFQSDNRLRQAYGQYFAMRTDFDGCSHSIILKCANDLMLIWSINPQAYWKLFFEIMEYAKLSMATIFKEFSNPNQRYTQPWLYSNNELEFGNISYKIPGTDRERKITNCRATAIFTCLLLYYQLLYNYGDDLETTCIITHNNPDILNYIKETWSNSLGNDLQAKAIRGVDLPEKFAFSYSRSLVYDKSESTFFTINNKKIYKSNYEELILYMRKYGISELPSNFNIANVHYSNADDMLNSISNICLLSFKNLYESKEYKDKYKKINTELNRINLEVKQKEKQISELEDTYKQKLNDGLKDLQDQLDEANRIIESKNKIINNLVETNKQLNANIDSIYTDDFNEEFEENSNRSVSIEDMVKELNEFKIVLAGGRDDLASKLLEYGWTNISQIDKNNYITNIDLAKNADFIVVNTKFISHALSYRIESMCESDRRMRFNGTNIDKLIESTYDFVSKYFN